MNDTELYSIVNDPGKKTPGGAGTHTGHTGHTGARGQSDHTDEPHNHPPKPKDTNPHDTVPVLYCTGYMYCTGTGKKTPGGAGTHSNLNHGQDTAHTCQISTADRTHARTGPDTQRAPAHTGHKRQVGAHRQTDPTEREPHNHPNPPTREPYNHASPPTHPHDLATTVESAAGATAHRPQPQPRSRTLLGTLPAADSEEAARSARPPPAPRAPPRACSNP